MSDCKYYLGYVDDHTVMIECSNGVTFFITHEASRAIVDGADITTVLNSDNDDTVELYSKSGPVAAIQIPIDQEKLRKALKEMYKCQCCKGNGYHEE